MKFDNLLIAPLVGVQNTEVVVSHVSIPPYTRLPMHWHPGEEFAYVLDGSLILHQEGEDDVSFTKGDVGVVPFKKVHTIETQNESATLLVFRVHAQGQPERVLVEAQKTA
ncbi:MAG: cupin domain-containing protein [Gammaproteobacteria bacterium]|nr:cupin domain-containing protein [Gammaproteobacteria bacterium]MDH5801580.1 cupin domain-containing protein [Gammaproteobacteria bacterium]